MISMSCILASQVKEKEVNAIPPGLTVFGKQLSVLMLGQSMGTMV